MSIPVPNYDVFISYRWVDPDQTWVREQLAPALRTAGLKVLLDVEDFVPGRDLILEMTRAGRESRRALCVLSPDYFDGNRMVSFESLMARRNDPSGLDSHLIPLVFRKAELPEWLRGLIPIDWTDQRIHAREWRKLLTVLEAPEKGVPPPHRLEGAPVESYRAFTSRLPAVNPTLIGRGQEIASLDSAWVDPAINIEQVIAAGGTGKTALVDNWFRRHLNEATIFGWSFVGQGTSADLQTSSDLFFTDVLKWFEIPVLPEASIYIKAEAIARRLRGQRVLLLLDGVEPLQDFTGALGDLQLKALLQELGSGHQGLVVCTTRVRIDVPQAIPLYLDNLTPEQGAQYLYNLKVKGTEQELQEASREYWNHALALTLLGTYLVNFCSSDIRRRVEIPKLMTDDVPDGAHARRVIAAYEVMLTGHPELDILRALAYFNRPAEPQAIRLVLPAMEDHGYRAALKRLYDARLILTVDTREPVDCHPLVREYFDKATTLEGHAILYEHYKTRKPQRPITLEEMKPLMHAIYHGCQAGQHSECFRSIYIDRIMRGKNEFYLTKKLGAFGTAISLLANFFENPWTQPVAALSRADRSWTINNAGLVLRAFGRLLDAIQPIQANAENAVGRANWRNAAAGYVSLSELQLLLGNIGDAIAAARHAVAFADRSGVPQLRTVSRTTLGNAKHQGGDSAEAMALFAEAEGVQADWRPESPILYGVQGYQYLDLLLNDQGYREEVVKRATQTLPIAERNSWLLEIGLDHLSLGCAYPSDSAEAAAHLEKAIDFIRRAGQIDFFPLALLARGTPRDLDEVHRIATRSNMRLYLVDYYLKKGNPEKAERLINETGYHRRDAALARLRTGE